MLKLFRDPTITPTRYYLADAEEPMFVPQEVQQAVGFLFMHKRHPIPMGTAFFISCRYEDDTPIAHYIVTAKHVIDKIKAACDDGKVHLRLNHKNGGTRFVDSPVARWRSHPTNPLIDIAVIAWDPPLGEFDIKVIPETMLGRCEPLVEQYEFGTGDEVFITGLFSVDEHVELGRNVPIVRIGNIAAMPNEPIQIQIGCQKGLVPTYLIEARSTGGLSGSPVFFNFGSIRIVKGNVMYAHDDAGNAVPAKFSLIGLVHGHYDEVLPRQKSSKLTDKIINMGIAKVVPVDQLIEVLNQPALVNERQKEKENFMRKKAQRIVTQDATAIARSVVEAAIGEPLMPAKGKTKKRAKKASRRAPK